MATNALREMVGWLQDSDHRKVYGTESIKADLALTLAEARKSLGLTQRQLADLTQVSQAYIAKLESGEANPTVGNVGAILGVVWLRLEFSYNSLLPADPSGPDVDFLGSSDDQDYEDIVLSNLGTGSGTAFADLNLVLPHLRGSSA